MIKLTRRSTVRASSRAKLADRATYITDYTHPDHKGKTICPAQNYGCPHYTRKAFIDEVLRLDAHYKKRRAGRRGKRSPRLFEEIIYSTPEGAFPTEAERDAIEGMIINTIARNTACRCAWHLDDDTGRADLHILLASKDHDGLLTLWANFGGKDGQHINAEFDRLDDDITAYLNQQDEPRPPLKSAATVRRKNNAPFAAELAEKHPEPITADTLLHTLAILGYTVTKATKKTVSVVFTGKKRAHRYNIEDLVLNIEIARERIRQREKSQPEKEVEPPPSDTPEPPKDADNPDASGDIA